MINIVAGHGENDNILFAIAKFKDKNPEVNIELVETDAKLVEAINNPMVDGVIRGSLNASSVLKFLRGESENVINRATFVRHDDYEFLLAPVGIDEGKTYDDKVVLINQANSFFESMGKSMKVGLISAGRKDDYSRADYIDVMLKDSEELERSLKTSFDIKNYYILIEEAIADGANLILAPNGVMGNLLFRSLVLVAGWESYGAVTLGIDEIYVDTSRSQSVEGYVRSLDFVVELVENERISLK